MMRALMWMLLLGCRTQPLADRDLSRPADLSQSEPQFVSCGRDQTCSIAAGEHCCDASPLFCATAPCVNADQFDCDGPEDCPGAICCFPIRDSFAHAACAADCPGEGRLCHSIADCPEGLVCCLNFVLGPGDGLCL